jgi:hypothetical protein
VTPGELGIPAGTRVERSIRDRGGGWQQEHIGIPVDAKPDRAEWPWMQRRDERGRIIGVLQLWYLAMTHSPSGFRLERRWRPSLGEDREWIATSRDGEFGLLGQARGLFRHAGRRPAVRGPEDIESAHAKLTRATGGRKPSTARLARELGMTTGTLRTYLARWDLRLEHE